MNKTLFRLLTALALVSPIAATAKDRPWTIVNLDNCYYTQCFGDEFMTAEAARKHVDAYLGGAVTHLFVNPQGMRAGYDSKVLEPAWGALNEPGALVSDSLRRAKLLHDCGVDLYDVWLKRAKERGREAWVSMRMNDCHGVDDTRNSCLSIFWLRRPDLWRVPFSRERDYDFRSFDYAHEEVRTLYLNVLREILDRYDADGIELDWTRMPDCLTLGREAELHWVLSSFMRQVRQIVDENAKRRGHPVRVAATVMSRPEVARGYGTDAVTWAREGLIDVLLVANRWMHVDFETPWKQWHEMITAANPHVRVIPRVENGCVKNGIARWGLTPDDYCGYFERLHHQGCRDFAFFNLFEVPQYGDIMRADRAFCYGEGPTPERVRAHRRIYPVTYLDALPIGLNRQPLYGLTDKRQFRFVMDRPRDVTIEIGSAAGVAEVYVNAVFDTDPPKPPAITLNGVAATDVTPGWHPEWLDGGRAKCAIRYRYPPSALKDEVNRIGYPVSPGDIAEYAEIEVVPNP